MDIKKHFTVNISESVLSKFCNASVKKSINKSLLIENFLKDWLSKNYEYDIMDDVVCTQHCSSYNSNVNTDH